MSLKTHPIEKLSQIDLLADRRSAHRARVFVRDTLAVWGREEMVSDVTLAVSELVTNAVVHARSSASLTLRNLPDGVRVQVKDGEPAQPEYRCVSEDALGGRGMHIVAAISDGWGVESSPPGKVVWLDIRDHH